MIKSKGLKLLGMFCVCSAVCLMNPAAARADEAQTGTDEGSAVVTVEAQELSLYSGKSQESEVVGQAVQGDIYEVVEESSDGWVKICSEDGTEGYLLADGKSAVISEDGQAAEEESDIRQDVVDYALTFLGNPYVYGGSDPNTGTDCSGFTSYVLEHAGGVDMNRSSRSQATQGTPVSAEQMQPGDLVFYANGSRINHVGLYIGDGQIVHASTEKTGIKTSPYDYRKPVKIVSLLS